MDAHPRFSMSQSAISGSTSELWATLSQPFLFPSPASSFNDLRELGVLEPMSSTTSGNSESNSKSLEIVTDRELKLDDLQRRLSLEFLNSNRRDVESELVYWTDRQERPVTGKDAASTLLSLKKPIVHNMSTVRSISPLPGVHTFRRKAEGLETLRSPAYGETPTDLGIQNRSSGYEPGRYQTHIDGHSSSVYYPPHPHVWTNDGYSSQVPYKSSHEISPPIVTVSRDCYNTSPMSFEEDSYSESFPVYAYTGSYPSSDASSHFPGGQMITSVRPQHDSKQHTVIKSVDNQINEYNCGFNGEVGARYYDCSPVASNISSSPTYGYNTRSLHDSSASHNRPVVGTTSGPASHHRVSDQITNKVKHNAAKNRPTNQCHVCSKTYGRPSTLKTHVRTHLGYRPYRCQLCGKSFTQPANLTAHIRIHSGEKPFNCTICSRHFSQSSSLKTHMRTHSGERPYVCNICKKSFADSSTLTKHRRTHTGEKPYQCTVCLQQFSQSGNLKRHMKVHTDN